MRYLVSYDLSDASSDAYQDLYDELERLGGEPVLESQWVVTKGNTSAEELCDQLVPLLREHDRLLVVKIRNSAAASWNLLNPL